MRSMARFKTKRTKCATVMPNKDCVKLVEDGLQRPLRKHSLVVKFTNLYHLSLYMARHEIVKALRALAKTMQTMVLIIEKWLKF